MAFTVLFLFGAALGNLAKSEGLGLLGKDWLKGLSMFCLSPIYAAIFFLSDGKYLTHEPHGLYMSDCEFQSFLKVCMPFSVCTVISMSIEFSGKAILWKNIWFILYCLWRTVESQCKPSESLLYHNMKEQGLSFDKAPNFELISKLL